MKETLSEKTSGSDGDLGIPNLIIRLDAQVVRMEKGVDPGALMILHEEIRHGYTGAGRSGASPVDFSVYTGRVNHDDHHEKYDEGVAMSSMRIRPIRGAATRTAFTSPLK